jgi:beta-N-acetylhexosaminidase
MQFLGNLDRPDVTARVAARLALELRAMEFDLDFAPVVDVHSNPKNPIIGDRAFGTTPERVSAQIVPFITAMQESGLIACAKHFPGHGDTRTDSHLELPVVEEDPDRLLAREVAPFAAAARAGVGTMMTAHVLYPVWDEENPATMSERILRGILREQIGYQGVIISDDLEMKAVRGRYPLEIQLERANRATVDLYLACKEPQLQYEVWEGLIRLQEEDKRQDDLAVDAMARLRALRERFLIDRPPVPDLSVLGGARELALRIRAEGAA